MNRPEDLIGLRKALGFSQHGMSNQMGLSLRAYQAIEAGETPYRDLHRLAAERVALMNAVLKEDPMMAPADVRRDALDLARMITGPTE